MTAIDFRQTAAAAVAAIVLATTFVGAAVGPAHAVETSPVQVAAFANLDEARA